MENFTPVFIAFVKTAEEKILYGGYINLSDNQYYNINH
jgi:hypothetical protein